MPRITSVCAVFFRAPPMTFFAYANRTQKLIPFPETRQMPSFRASGFSGNPVINPAITVIAGFPQVAVFSAIIQILRHPDLRTHFHSPVSRSVPAIYKLPKHRSLGTNNAATFAAKFIPFLIFRSAFNAFQSGFHFRPASRAKFRSAL